MELRTAGLYCPQADLYIDPWRSVDKAVITHAHADHCRRGHKSYLAHKDSEIPIYYRLGKKTPLECIEWGESVDMNGVTVSLHPAAHIIGSSQVRLEYKGEVWVISGDYKTADDGISGEFEVVKCNHFISECTFGLPVFRWQQQELIYREMREWWQENATEGLASVISAYSLGKAQRVISAMDGGPGRIFAHPVIADMQELLIEGGYKLPEVLRIPDDAEKGSLTGDLIITPPGAADAAWLKPALPYRNASVSGWMGMRGFRRRSPVDRGFVLSDHADWTGLNEVIRGTGAENVYLTHGYSDIFSRYLSEQGLNAQVLETAFSSNDLEEEVGA